MLSFLISPQRQPFCRMSSFSASRASSCGGRGTSSPLRPRIWVYHQGEWWRHIPSLELHTDIITVTVSHNMKTQWREYRTYGCHISVVMFMLPLSSTALLLSKLQASSQVHPGGHSNSSGLWDFSPFYTTHTLPFIYAAFVLLRAFLLVLW